MSSTTFRVDASSLNLRSAPSVVTSNRIAVLSRGQLVQAIGSADDVEWLMVSVPLNGHSVSGYVAKRFLVPDADFDPPPPYGSVSPVHLREGDPGARRSVAGKRALPIGEADAPRRRSPAGVAERVADLIAVADWLNVEHSPRYLPTASSTYCNIYAHDYCYLAGVYLPRVWWTSKAVALLTAGTAVKPVYGSTIHELNANSLFEWLLEFGGLAGWERVFDPEALQAAANDGGVGTICAQRADLNLSGHIAVVVPESNGHTAIRVNGQASRPLQSQAGRTNLRYSTKQWWTDAKFRQYGFWVHP